MAKEMHFPASWDDFGPKMHSLREMERRFCWAYTILAMAGGGYVSRAEAAIAAGYSNVADGAKVRANEVMQRQRVLEALDELAQREMRGMAIPALMVMKRKLESPLDVDQFKAAMAILNRVGLHEKSTVEHVHTVDTKELEALARRLAAESGIDPARLLGGNQKVIEHEPSRHSAETSFTGVGDSESQGRRIVNGAGRDDDAAGHE